MSSTIGGKEFLDSNLLVYAHDRGQDEKHHRAKALVSRLWQERSGVLSTQVVQEFWVNVRRKAKRPLSAANARQVVEDYLRWEVVINDTTSVLAAIELEQRYQIAFWDALILQAAQISGARVLHSEDLNHGQAYGSVVVQNPFLT